MALALSGYPVSGTISQDGRTVGLGYERGVCGPINPGEQVVCTDDSGTGGVHEIPLKTPGTVRIHLSRAARVLRAGDRAARGTVRQLDPTDATVTFHVHLRRVEGTGIERLREYGWVAVERAGREYRLLFDPT